MAGRRCDFCASGEQLTLKPGREKLILSLHPVTFGNGPIYLTLLLTRTALQEHEANFCAWQEHDAKRKIQI